MRHAADVPATLPTPMDAPHDLMPTSLTTPPPPTPWWWRAQLFHGVQTWMTSVAWRRVEARRDLRPDFPRQDTPVDILARKHTFLYAYSLSG
jgi:hypothetical protein